MMLFLKVKKKGLQRIILGCGRDLILTPKIKRFPYIFLLIESESCHFEPDMSLEFRD